MSEPDVSGLLSVAEAIAILDATPVEPRVSTSTLDAAMGRRLAEDIHADRDYPPFDKSLMDGYAVRCDDVAAQAPTVLRVVGEIAAGQFTDRTIMTGETMAIMTGAPIPSGADGIVPVEDAVRNGDNVSILKPTIPGRFIARRGSDCAAGAALLTAGMMMNASSLAVAASVGKAALKLIDRPTTAVLATGDELVAVDQQPIGAQIRNSNNVLIGGLLRTMGSSVHDLGVASDNPSKIRAAMGKGLESCDVLIVSGGMSMGEYDWCPRVMREMGIDLRITKLKIKPGKPFVFGVKGKKFVFGLPGNPVSGFVCTLRLCSRILNRMAGGDPEPRWLVGTLDAKLSQNGPREFYQPAVYNDGRVRPLAWKGSADIYTLAAANALLVRAENEPALPAGASVKLLEIPSS